MIVWGGLCPIPSQAVVDGIVLVGFGYLTFQRETKERRKSSNDLQLIFSLWLIMLYQSENLTNRWSIIFPAIPFTILQLYRRRSRLVLLLFLSSEEWISMTTAEAEKTNKRKRTKYSGVDTRDRIILENKTLREVLKENEDDNSSINCTSPSGSSLTTCATSTSTIISGNYDSKTKGNTNSSNFQEILNKLILIFSIFFLLVATASLILFPSVELPPPATTGWSSITKESSAKYNVGVVDLFFDVSIQHKSSIYDIHKACPTSTDHLSVRLLYPSDKIDNNNNNGSFFWRSGDSIRYLKPKSSAAYCEENMKHAAPEPLRAFSWLLHQWRLARLSVKRNAPPLTMTPTSSGDAISNNKKLPIVFYSHGLGGNADTYSYQTASLAANGYVVAVIEHTDGSAAVIPRKDGSILRRDDSVMEDDLNGKKERYDRSRQAMTEYRAEELLAVVNEVQKLNTYNLPQLESLGISFVNKLDTNEIHYMGHSFGASTAFHAAWMAGNLSSLSSSSSLVPISIIAHEPVIDWMPEGSRNSLFDLSRLKGSKTNYTRFIAKKTKWRNQKEKRNMRKIRNFRKKRKQKNRKEKRRTRKIRNNWRSLHDQSNILILSSNEWAEEESLSWSAVDVFQDMYQRQVLGSRNNNNSRVEVIRDTKHMEFSDVCMMTPLWMSRRLGMQGPRNPIDTAYEIHSKTLQFLNNIYIHRQKEDNQRREPTNYVMKDDEIRYMSLVFMDRDN